MESNNWLVLSATSVYQRVMLNLKIPYTILNTRDRVPRDETKRLKQTAILR
jgi:hypothetical protein